jgi:hypothetical protein
MKLERHLISDNFLETTLVGLIRKSDRLRAHVEHWDRMITGHADRSYAWIHGMIGKVVVEERQRRNREAMLQEHAQSQKTTAAPAATSSPATSVTPTATNKRERRPRGTGDGGSDDGRSTGSSVRLGDIEYKDRCCIRHLWKKCEETVENGGCRYGPHIKNAPEIIQKHSLYINMLAENGAPEHPKGKGKGKGRGKGKDKGKEAAPAEVETAPEPTP